MSLLDQFTDTNGVLLQSHTPTGSGSWTKHANSSNTAQIATNRVRPTANAEALYWHDWTPANAEYDVEADLYFAGTNGDSSGPAGRIDTTANKYYYRAGHNYGSARWEITRAGPAGFSTLATSAATLTVGQTYHVKLEIRNATKKAYIDGSPTALLTSSDNNVTAAGRAGFRLFGGNGATTNSNGYHLDNFATSDTSVNHQAAGTSAGVGSGSGAIAVSRPVSGVSAGTGGATGNASVQRPFDGISTGLGSGSGAISVARTIAGASPGVGAGSGNLAILRPIAGTSPGVGAGRCDASVYRPFSAISAGLGGGSGSILVLRRVAGVSDGSGSGDGAIYVWRTVVGVSGGVGGGSGAATVGIIVIGTPAYLARGSLSVRDDPVAGAMASRIDPVAGVLTARRPMVGVLATRTSEE